MSDNQGKELSPDFSDSDLEEPILVPIAETTVLPQNPPAVLAEVRDLDDFEAWPSVEVSVPTVKPAQIECCFIDDSDIGFSVEIKDAESESKSGSPGVGKIEKESESGTSAALGMQASQAQAQSWPEEEEIYGFLHIYKVSGKSPSKERARNSLMLGILNIPAMVTRNHLRNFLAPFQEVIDEIKIIQDTTPSRYIALIRFNAEDVADTFYAVYSGCSFNEKDGEACQMVYVEKFEVLKSGGRASFPMQNLIELPRCTICLERTGGSMRGILTWLCDQSLEGQSYESQYGLTCPVCTYYYMPEQEEPRCLACGFRESLHICLICGFVGCGQYVTGHAKKHFGETKHAYGMQLSDQKVWDYTEENYVDSDVDHSYGNVGQYRKEANEDNVSSTQLEYSYFLSRELETQQFFWEQKMTQLEKESHDEINNLKTKLRATIEKCNKLEFDLFRLVKEKQAVEKKCTQLTAQLCRISIELKEEQEKNETMKANQIFIQNQLEEEDKVLTETCEQIEMQITEIQNQLQDIILYLEEQQKDHGLAAESPEDPEDPQEGQSNVSTAAPESLPQEEDQ